LLEARFARRLAPEPAGREGVLRGVAAELLDLTMEPAPEAERWTQLLHGEAFRVFAEEGGFAWGRSEVDGYVGYVPAAGLGAPVAEGRAVTALAAPVYPGPSIKLRERALLPWLARVAVEGEAEGFARLAGGGCLCSQHLAPVAGDFVAQAARLLGVPYLWGGRSPRGLDCSALVQLALAATGVGAPRDSDMQEAWLGEALPETAPPARGDLVFWKGHVGIMEDAATLLHANAFHMAVAREPFAEAAARIAASGGGPVTARRRLAPGDPGWRPPV
jgi:hypothetical protein